MLLSSFGFSAAFTVILQDLDTEVIVIGKFENENTNQELANTYAVDPYLTEMVLDHYIENGDKIKFTI